MSQSYCIKESFYKSLLLSFFLLVAVSCKKDDTLETGVPPEGGENPEIPETNGDLPSFTITTNGNTIVDEPKVSGRMVIAQNDQLLFEGPIGIEFRGASSQGFEKKSYGLETWDESGQDIDVSLLGFPEEEDWILYGPYSDKSLLRNHLIYNLARDMGRYASRSELVELNLNGTYRGVYVFMEKLKRDGDRINISKLNPDEITGEDLTGGYILKIDKLSGNNAGGSSYNEINSFESSFGPLSASTGQTIKFVYEDPEADVITSEQKQYIQDYMADFEAALAGDDFTDPILGYANYMDVDSFIDFFILNELSNNVDGYRLSTYMYKNKNEKLAMGPIWDFNLAFGNADYCGGGETDLWAYKFNERCTQDFWMIPFWWERLLQDPAFVDRLKQRWSALRGNTLSNDGIKGRIDGFVDRMEAAGSIDRNFQSWNILGVYIWPNGFVGDTYEQESDYLKTWVDDRLAWLDGAIGEL